MSALEILCGIQDTYISSTAQLQHNLRFITFPNGDPAELLPWDMDFVFGAAANSSVFLTSSYNLGKLLNTPATRRLYLHHINDLCQTAFTTDYMTPWINHYAAVVGQNFSAAPGYIASRRAYALTQLPGAVPFAITSNGGNGFAANTNLVLLSGTGWIDVRDIEVNGVPYAVQWSTLTNWSLLLPVRAGTNFLTVQAIDRSGVRRPALSDSISVTNTIPATLLPVVINEWMANNVGPGGLADSLDGLFQDWFELYNPNDTPVDLGGHYLTDDLASPTKWKVPTNSVIGARGFLLVWADANGSQNSPTNVDLHANFKLSNGGESIGLFASDGLSPLHAITFGPQLLNVSEGLFPDGAVGTRFLMTNWTPRASNRLGLPASPQVSAFSITAGVLSVSFSAIPARTYQVEYTDSLEGAAWLPLGAARTAGAGAMTVTEFIGAVPQRFFRVRLQ